MGINKKNAIITFDYEVFLGRETGTTEKCVINPTKSILKVLSQNNAKAIFFVDAAWLLFLKENFPDDFLLVSGQLKSIIESGSSVELHLHPQWIKAYKTGNRIFLNSLQHYKLHLLSGEEILDLFNKSINLLQGITNQKVSCFRAGGWCIEPFNKIRDAFEAFGIKYDFSVVPGISLKEDKAYDYDFSRAPELTYYRFQDDINRPDEKGRFTEFPVSTYYNNPVYRIVNKAILKLIKDHIFGDGTGTKEKSTYRTFNQVFRFSKGMLTLDKTSNLLFRYFLRTHFRRSSTIVIVSHPKLMSAEALLNLDYITKKFNTVNSSELDKFLPN
jgi:hypothetical protein